MNDEFLYQLRTRPSPEFADRLKKRLDRQAAAAASRKRSLRWCAALGVILCGTSLAVMSPSVRHFALTVISMLRPGEPAANIAESGKDSEPPERSFSIQDLRSELWRQQQAPLPARTASQTLGGVGSEENNNPAGSESAAGVSEARTGTTTGSPVFAAGQVRDSIRIVSASRTYALTSRVAEEFASRGRYRKPEVRRGGLQDAFDLFCNGLGAQHIDIADATRRMTTAMMERCFNNGVREIVEIRIGYLAVTLARSSFTTPLQLSPREIYLALAEQIPDPMPSQGMSVNRTTTWRQINPALPDEPIQVLGPPRGTELYALFEDLVLDAGCKTFAGLKALAKTDLSRYRQLCFTPRQDGVYVDAGGNEALLLQQVATSQGAVGIFSFNFFKAHGDQLTATPLGGFDPVLQNVTSGKYSASRTLYVYVKTAHLGVAQGLRPFVSMYVDESAIGPRGFLVDRGLIPVPTLIERNVIRRNAEAFRTLQPEDIRRQP